MKRRICWPTFDKVCLQGGCLYCNDKPFRSVDEIERIIGPGPSVLRTAFEYGRDQNWNNAESR